MNIHISQAGPDTLPVEGLGLFPADQSRVSGPAGRKPSGPAMKNGASAMRETGTETGGAIKGLRSYIAAVSVALIALLGVLGSSASAASAEGTWWGLSSGARPTYVHAGVGKPGKPGIGEVQEIFTTPGEYEGHAEQTNFKLTIINAEKEPELIEEFITEPLCATLCGSRLVLLSAGNIQKALEKTEIYGSGNVTVKEETVDKDGKPLENGDKRYVVSSIGADSEKVVPALESVGEIGTIETKVTTASVPGTPATPDGEIYVSAENLGDQTVSGRNTPVTISDVLPAGLRAIAIEATKPDVRANFLVRDPLPCSSKSEVEEGKLSCTMGKEEKVPSHEALAPYDQIEMRIAVDVEPGAEATEQVNEVKVSGGESYACAASPGTGKYRDSGCTEEVSGEEEIETSEGAKVKVKSHGNFERSSTGLTAPAAAKAPVKVSSAPVPFGVESFLLAAEEEGGEATRQAGAHPFQLTTSIALNQTADTSPPGSGLGEAHVNPAGLAKDVQFKWPAGLIGNPTPIAQCTDVQFFQVVEGGAANLCPPDSAVGVATVTINEPSTTGVAEITVPLFNLVPRVGEPARFGFNVTMGNAPVTIDTSVRTGGDYGINVSVNNITQTAAFLASKVTVWGVPGDVRHDRQRGWGCLLESRGFTAESPLSPCGSSAGQTPPPFLSMPTACEGPLVTSAETDPWSQPGAFQPFPGTFSPQSSLVGCNRLPFSSEIKVTPDGQQASTPTGLKVDVHVPQEEDLNSAGVSSSNIRDIAVKLPAGVAVNPSSADGLGACSEGLVGFTGFGEVPGEPGVNNPLFTPKLPGSFGTEGSESVLQPGVNFCADASKIGEVAIKTPLLPANQPVKGFVYLADQEANPFNSVLAMYIVAEDPVSGSLVKLPGEVQICQGAGEAIAGFTCEVQGQLISTFENTPQLAFEDAELHFFGGERAPLTSPTRCGTYTTEAAFTPWSGTPAVHSTSSFDINSGPNHTACTYPGQALPFSPTLTGGATNIQAGAFSPFTLTMSRLPGEQNLQSVEAHLPPGLSGILSNIELCPEPQANQGACGPNSLIGETTVSVGVGGTPFTVSGGKFFLTGPYNGTSGCTVGTAGCAPFGITFEVPAKAGPFDFAKTARNHPACDCVLVRGKIEIDPLTAAITIVSNPPGTPNSIPTHLEGIPLEIQKVNAITTRSNFQFNPTNCNKMAVSGTIHSSEGGTDTINVPLQVTNCGALKFAPKFSVSTSGKTSKEKGASLTAKVTYPQGPQGTYANITRVKVDLPKQLPSRLTTLQKACPAKTFEEGFEKCLKDAPNSKIGEAIVYTPLLPVPLKGPAIFVSHGGEAFPSLTMVLQGYGVTVDLVGTTFISKAGITSTTFKTVPDVPFSSFTLTLPQGKFSALAANGNLCTSKLAMPTEFLAQNGLKINESTKISVTGCAKKKALTRPQKLAAALKACHKKAKGKRAGCEKAAHNKYGPLKRTKKKGK
jgi:hypothetical protein